MASLLQNVTIKVRRDTAGNFTSNNPTPNQGEWCYETDTGKVKIGDGSTAWTSLAYITDVIAAITLSVSGVATLATVTVSGALLTPYYHIQDQKTAGTSGGTATLGSWEIRDLNTEIENTITGASLADPVITLPAGTYRIAAKCPVVNTAKSMARLYNITDAAVEVWGQSSYSHATSVNSINSEVDDTFTIAGTKTFRIEQKVEATKAAFGHGLECNSALTVDHETYSDVKIWKIA